MKAQRRHELQQSDLAKVIKQAPGFWQQSGGRWLLALTPTMAGLVALDAVVATPLGMAWLAATCVVMFSLAAGKARTGRELGNRHALDAHRSAGGDSPSTPVGLGAAEDHVGGKRRGLHESVHVGDRASGTEPGQQRAGIASARSSVRPGNQKALRLDGRGTEERHEPAEVGANGRIGAGGDVRSAR